MSKSFWLLFAAALSLVVGISAPSALAEQIYLQYTTFGGNTPTTEGPLTPAMGTAVATDHSAVLTTNNAEVGAVWMDTAVNTQANSVTLDFDINVLAQAAPGPGQYGQDFGGAQTLAGVRIAQSGVFAESFQLMPTSATTGTFAFRNATNTGVQTLGSYNTNTTYHITLEADYVNGVANAYINGVLAFGGYPLRPGTAVGGTTSEIFVYLNGTDGVHNSIQISSAPLPTSAAASFSGLGALAFARSIRRRASAVAIASH